MNMRKFYFITSIIVSIFLFITGITIIFFINKANASTGFASDDNNPINNILQPYVQGKGPFNVLVLGGDKVNNNSDTMMLMNFDPATSKISIMSIPRDTKVLIDGTYRKINYAYPHGGINLTVQTVSELLDVNIKYFVYVDTAAFRKVIDLLGGVDFYIPANMDYDDPTQNLHIHLKKGQRHLNGSQSEQFIRFRDPNVWTKEIKQFYDGSDLKRIEAQQDFLKALIDQKLNFQYIPKLNSIINVIFDNIETNFAMNDVLKLTGYASKINSDSLNFISMPGKPFDGSPWYYLCDVEKTREIAAESFKCNDSFVNVQVEKKNAYKNDSGSSESTKPPKTATESGKKSVTKNNPSNSDSSLKGTQTPAP